MSRMSPSYPGRLRFQRKAEEQGLSRKGQGRAAAERQESQGGNSDFQSAEEVEPVKNHKWLG